MVVCRSTSRGSAALAVVFLAATLTLLGAPFILVPLNLGRLEQRVDQNVDALAVAEAGAELAIWEFNSGGDFLLAEGWQDCEVGMSRSVCVKQLGVPILSATGGNIGTADVFAYDKDTQTPRVESTGRAQGSGVMRQVVAKLQKASAASPFQQALYGTIAMPFSPGIWLGWGALVDSYDSSVGPYGGANVRQNAHVQTSSANSNSLTDGSAVHLFGGSTLRGNADTAPNGVVLVSDTSVMTGIPGSQLPKTFPVAPDPAPPGTCTPLGSVHVTSGVVDYLDEYYCGSTITVETGGQVRFPNLQELYLTFDVLVYTGGRVQFGQGQVRARSVLATDAGSRIEGTAGQLDIYTGGFRVAYQGLAQGAGQLPANLRLYQTGGATGTMGIDNQGTVYGTIYAPTRGTAVDDSGSALYGAMIGPQAHVNAGTVHFDEQLTASGSWPGWLSGGSAVTVTSWSESPH